MSVETFIHLDPNTPSTLSEIKRIYELIAPSDFFGLFAYATQSGLASFETEFGDEFWGQTQSRWLFGLDYGRTQPGALQRLSAKQNVEIRIFDGDWIVDQAGFMPRRDFHAKLSLASNVNQSRFGMIVGSGNFSSNGLRRSIEAGASIYVDNQEQYDLRLASANRVAGSLWDEATPLDVIVDRYTDHWGEYFWREVDEENADQPGFDEPKELFWIEAGYVTKNRGPDSPGNQIDLPRGMSRYFGFHAPDDLAINTVIGAITFRTPVSGPVTRNLRLGNNHMEKITLPIPETHGFDIYDGKVLVFQNEGGDFAVRALETSDFEAAFGDRIKDVRMMSSGRRYGHIG